jgi:hypothetical protein
MRLVPRELDKLILHQGRNHVHTNVIVDRV